MLPQPGENSASLRQPIFEEAEPAMIKAERLAAAASIRIKRTFIAFARSPVVVFHRLCMPALTIRSALVVGVHFTNGNVNRPRSLPVSRVTGKFHMSNGP